MDRGRRVADLLIRVVLKGPTVLRSIAAQKEEV
jgi:hypothetical protein